MKKRYILVSLMLFSCTNQITSNPQKDSSLALSTTNYIILNNCDFNLDLENYTEKDKEYSFENTYGNGHFSTNKLYFDFTFNFKIEYHLDKDFTLTFNENIVTVFTIDFNNNEIKFKVEDTNWSKVY